MSVNMPRANPGTVNCPGCREPIACEVSELGGHAFIDKVNDDNAEMLDCCDSAIHEDCKERYFGGREIAKCPTFNCLGALMKREYPLKPCMICRLDIPVEETDEGRTTAVLADWAKFQDCCTQVVHKVCLESFRARQRVNAECPGGCRRLELGGAHNVEELDRDRLDAAVRALSALPLDMVYTALAIISIWVFTVNGVRELDMNGRYALAEQLLIAPLVIATLHRLVKHSYAIYANGLQQFRPAVGAAWRLRNNVVDPEQRYTAATEAMLTPVIICAAIVCGVMLRNHLEDAPDPTFMDNFRRLFG